MGNIHKPYKYNYNVSCKSAKPLITFVSQHINLISMQIELPIKIGQEEIFIFVPAPKAEKSVCVWALCSGAAGCKTTPNSPAERYNVRNSFGQKEIQWRAFDAACWLSVYQYQYEWSLTPTRRLCVMRCGRLRFYGIDLIYASLWYGASIRVKKSKNEQQNNNFHCWALLVKVLNNIFIHSAFFLFVQNSIFILY